MLVTNTSDVPKVISINVPLLHIHSLLAKKRSWYILFRVECVGEAPDSGERRGWRQGVELRRVYFEGLAVHYSAMCMAESQTCHGHLLSSIIPLSLIYKIALQFSTN